MLLETNPHSGDHTSEKQPTQGSRLLDIGVDYNLSARAKRIASVPDDKFETAIAMARQEEQQNTRRAIRIRILPGK